MLPPPLHDAVMSYVHFYGHVFIIYTHLAGVSHFIDYNICFLRKKKGSDKDSKHILLYKPRLTHRHIVQHGRNN
jgi:hypothetical protein